MIRIESIDDVFVPNDIKPAIDKMRKELSGLYLFYGKPGTGKTTLARMIAKEKTSDILFIEASIDSGIDMIREKIISYIKAYSITGEEKIIIMDEIDNLSQNAQMGFRNATNLAIEHNIPIIATCNYIDKLQEPIRKRFIQINFKVPTKKEMLDWIINILNKNNIKYDKDVLNDIINNVSDFRELINNINLSIENNELKELKHLKNQKITKYIIDFITKLINNTNEFDTNRIHKAIEYIDKNSSKILYDEIFENIIKSTDINFYYKTIAFDIFYKNTAIDKSIRLIAFINKIAYIRG